MCRRRDANISVNVVPLILGIETCINLSHHRLVRLQRTTFPLFFYQIAAEMVSRVVGLGIGQRVKSVRHQAIAFSAWNVSAGSTVSSGLAPRRVWAMWMLSTRWIGRIGQGLM